MSADKKTPPPPDPKLGDKIERGGPNPKVVVRRDIEKVEKTS